MNKLYKNVFVIDDNQADITFIKAAFKENELIHKISPFTDSVDFIEYTQRRNYWKPIPDVILLDLNMPNADGMAVTEAVRKSEKFKNTPIVILSGQDDKELVDESYQKGANVYMKKPSDYYGWVEMVNALDKMLLEVKIG